MKNIVAQGNMREFYEKHPDAKNPLLTWYDVTKKADWKTPHDVKQSFKTADPIANSRVVINIAGNKYRLILEINYQNQWVYICFIGTHQEYDKVDAATVSIY
jgi:mRNA interferase HigB